MTTSLPVRIPGVATSLSERGGSDQYDLHWEDGQVLLWENGVPLAWAHSAVTTQLQARTAGSAISLPARS